jgi:hypothetical protein
MEQVLKCKICQNSYNTDIKKPIIILCGHTFCKLCLSKTEYSKCAICGISVDMNVMITNHIVEEFLKMMEFNNINSPIIAYTGRSEKRSPLSANINFNNYIRSNFK